MFIYFQPQLLIFRFLFINFAVYLFSILFYIVLNQFKWTNLMSVWRFFKSIYVKTYIMYLVMVWSYTDFFNQPKSCVITCATFVGRPYDGFRFRLARDLKSAGAEAVIIQRYDDIVNATVFMSKGSPAVCKVRCSIRLFRPTNVYIYESKDSMDLDILSRGKIEVKIIPFSLFFYIN
jgi:hypothetical protein